MVVVPTTGRWRQPSLPAAESQKLPSPPLLATGRRVDRACGDFHPACGFRGSGHELKARSSKLKAIPYLACHRLVKRLRRIVSRQEAYARPDSFEPRKVNAVGDASFGDEKTSFDSFIS